MSAIVCGKRSSFFEDNNSIPSSPPVSKRIRFSSSSTSPVRFSPPRSTTAAADSPSSQFNLSSSSSSRLDHLAALFPDMDKQLLERALEGCGGDLDSTIRSLNELRLGSAENVGSPLGNLDAAQEVNVQYQTRGIVTSNGEAVSTENSSASQNIPTDGADWVELFVTEMMGASNVDELRTRASRALELLEQSICARASEAAHGLQQENNMLKEQLQALIQENTVLKRAVSIQHERQKEFEDKSQELHHLKQMVSQYQEQLRTLEVNNYALTMHLKQAQQSNSLPGRFHPDIF